MICAMWTYALELYRHSIYRFGQRHLTLQATPKQCCCFSPRVAVSCSLKNKHQSGMCIGCSIEFTEFLETTLGCYTSIKCIHERCRHILTCGVLGVLWHQTQHTPHRLIISCSYSNNILLILSRSLKKYFICHVKYFKYQ